MSRRQRFSGPCPPGYGEHLWAMLCDPHSRLVHISTPKVEPCGSDVMMADDFAGCAGVVYPAARRYRVTVVREDVEDFKYGGPFPESQHFSCPRRAYIAYAFAVIRETLGWHHLDRIGAAP